jgi:hypothetical protein
MGPKACGPPESAMFTSVVLSYGVDVSNAFIGKVKWIPQKVRWIFKKNVFIALYIYQFDRAFDLKSEGLFLS